MQDNTSSSPPHHVAILVAPLLVWVVGSYLLCPTDPDLWWHLTMGQVIVDTRSIPRTDIFSFLSFGRPIVAHEWLSEVVFALIYRASGYVGLSVIWALLASLTVYVVYRTCRIRGIDPLAASLVSALATRLLLIGGGVRPQLVTLLCTSIVVCALTRVTRYGWYRSLWGLPFLLCVWANAHGGYILGVALLWLACLVGWFSLERGVERKLLILSGIGTLATLVNPYGQHLWLYPLQYANFGSASLRYILEWQSPNFHDPTTIVMLIIVLVMGVFGVRQRPSVPLDVVLAVLFTAMGLTSNRHIPLFGVVVTPIVFARVLHELTGARRWLSGFDPRAVGAALLVVIPLGMAVRLSWEPPESRTVQLGREPSAGSLPSGAARVLRDELSPGNLLNEYDWGGYLIYTLYPKWKIGVDGRADVHGDLTMDLNYQIFNGAQGWQETVERLNVSYLLVRKGGPLEKAIEREPSWSRVYDGAIEKLFARRTSFDAPPSP